MMRRMIVISVTLVLSVYLHAVADTPDPLADADASFAAGDWSTAAEIYRAATERSAEDGRAWLGLGLSLIRLKQYDDSADAFDRAIDLKHSLRSSTLGAARAYAAAASTAVAFERLASLVSMGPPGHSALRSGAEFASMRDDPRFDKIIQALNPCARGKHRDFDFWLGEWNVQNARAPNRPPSQNSLTAIDDGCAMLEQYRTPGGYTGTSISYYDPTTGQWIQSWMDNQGQAILHRGGLTDDGTMVLTDDPPKGQPRNRTTWTPLEDGRVRQHWERSSDGGKSWTTVFDGIYSRN